MKRSYLLTIAALAICAFSSNLLFAKQISYTSSVKRAHLLELFSTQSCSSCPPAQKYFNKLKDHKNLFQAFFPIVFHVDYWDYLGWKDPYSKKQFTQRQRNYASKWKARSVYTPAAVLNGKEWLWRSSSKDDFLSPTDDVGVLKVTLSNDQTFDVAFTPTRSNLPKNLTLHTAILGMDIQTDIKGGELRGLQSKHDFLTLDLSSHLLSKRKSEFYGTYKFPKPLKTFKNDKALIFWVQEDKSLRPIQVTGGYYHP